MSRFEIYREAFSSPIATSHIRIVIALVACIILISRAKKYY